MPTTEATPAGTTTGVDVACAACPHGREAHDRIGTRFCSATIAGGLSRGCVCVGDALAAVPQTAEPQTAEPQTAEPHTAEPQTN